MAKTFIICFAVVIFGYPLGFSYPSLFHYITLSLGCYLCSIDI